MCVCERARGPEGCGPRTPVRHERCDYRHQKPDTKRLVCRSSGNQFIHGRREVSIVVVVVVFLFRFFLLALVVAVVVVVVQPPAVNPPPPATSHAHHPTTHPREFPTPATRSSCKNLGWCDSVTPIHGAPRAPFLRPITVGGVKRASRSVKFFAESDKVNEIEAGRKLRSALAWSANLPQGERIEIQ